VRAAEGREEVIQGILVRNIDRRQIEVHLVAIFVEEIILADGGVEEVAGRDARRVLVVVLRSRRGNAQ